MFSYWPIRKKLLFGCAQLVAVLALLAYGSFHGVYAYRGLVKGLSSRAAELPLAAELARGVSDLRAVAAELRAATSAEAPPAAVGQAETPQRFADGLAGIAAALAAYRSELAKNEAGELPIRDSHREWETVHKIEHVLDELTHLTQPTALAAGEQVDRQLQRLQTLAAELPSNLHQRIGELARDVRGQYRTWIILAWIASVAAGITLIVLVRLSYRWVFRPLRSLVDGARRISAGEFSYRVRLDSHDEMAELAAALNEAVARFESIRDDLDRQVQERTRQVVRSEQLASVGFLAAGVAHEINNPLASIAMCAESLDGRLRREPGSDSGDGEQDDDALIHSYLRMIQTEAFRCKEITERLLDFARLGESKRVPTDLAELVQGVVDMVGHLGKYHSKRIEFAPAEAVVAPVNPQEIKQVVLNLLTNALDSLDEGGLVRIELARRFERAVLSFTDNGCGLSDEVRQHLFEPFFTRRRHGQGVGLGLSITYRIVTDHGGQLEATSDGPGRGSRFAVSLPLAESEKELCHRYQAA